MQTRSTLHSRRARWAPGVRSFARSPVAIAVAAALGISMHATVFADPTGGIVVEGQGTISTPNAGTTIIDQSSQQLNLSWESFNVGANERVTFNQPSSNAVAVNRILDQNPSQIFGRIDANGKVALVNPNGLLIGRTAQLNVGSLVASSLEAIDFDSASGRYRFSTSRGETGAVTNEGSITAAAGGSVTLLGGRVTNTGNILADFGTVNLAAGRAATIDLAGDGLLRLEVGTDLFANSSGATSAVENSGAIQSNGGQVLLTASAIEGVFTNLVNNTGVVRANRIDNTGGTIQLVGPEGMVLSSGTLDASAGDEISTGGSVAMLGDRVGLLGNAVVDVSGATGGGTALIGGDYQGSNPDIINATRTFVSAGSTINADAGTQGDGGRIIIWSNDSTRYNGSLSARGGTLWGNGGFAEVSGKHTLDFNGTASLTASHGTWGSLLLDPENIRIDSSNGAPSGLNNGGDGNYLIGDDAGQSVTIGNLTIQNLLGTVGNVTLHAGNSITQDAGANIDVRGAASALHRSLGLYAGTGGITLNGRILTNNGDVTLDTSGNIAMGVGSAIDSGFGTVTMIGQDVTVTSIATVGIVRIMPAGSLFNDGDVNTRIFADQLFVTANSGAIGASGATGAIDTNVNSLSLEAHGGGIYVREQNGLSAVGAVSDAGSVAVTALLGDITFSSAVGSTGVTIDALAGSIFDTGFGAGVIGGSGPIALHALHGIGTITDYAQRLGAPIRISGGNTLSAQVENGVGRINLQVGNSPVLGLGAIRVGDGNSSAGQVLLQSQGFLFTDQFADGAINLGTFNDSQVTLSAGVAGGADAWLRLGSSGSIFSSAPGELTLHGSDITDFDGSPNTITVDARALRYESSAPSADKILNSNAGRLDVFLANGRNFTLNQTGNVQLGTIDVSGGDVTLTALGGSGLFDDSDDSTSIIGNAVTLTGGLVGISGDEVDTRATTLTLNSPFAGVHVREADDVTVLSATAASTVDVRTLNGAMSVGAVSGLGVTLATGGTVGRGLTLTGPIDGRGRDVTLTAGGGTTGGNIIDQASTPITADTLTVSGATIGMLGGPLQTNVNRIVSTSTVGATTIVEADDLASLRATSAGALHVRTVNGAMTVDSASGTRVELSTFGPGKALTVAGSIDGGAGAVTLAADRGAIIAVSGNEIAGASLTLTGSAIGSASERLNTAADSIAGTASAGGIYLQEADDVTVTSAAATGGDIAIATTAGDLSVTSASGGNISLAAAGVLKDLTVGGLNAGTGGNITLSATDELIQAAGGPIVAGSLQLTARSIGSSGARLATVVGSLDATSTAGSLYITEADTVSLQASATGGSVDVATTNGALNVTSASGADGVTLTSAGANNNLTVNGAVNGESGAVTLAASGDNAAILVNDTITTSGDVSLTAGSSNARGSISGSGVHSIAGENVTLVASSIGSSASRVRTNATAIDATATNGNIYIQEATWAQLDASATGGTVDVATTDGALSAGAVSGSNVTLNAGGALSSIAIGGLVDGGAGGTVTLTAGSDVAQLFNGGRVVADTLNVTASRIGSSSSALATTVTTLNATSTNGSTFIAEADDVSLTASASGGMVVADTINGVLTVDSVSSVGAGSAVWLTSGGAGNGINLNGAIATPGDVHIDAGYYADRGALVVGSNGSIAGNDLTIAAASIGSFSGPLMTNVSSLDAQGTTGDIHVREADDLTVTSALAAGTVDIGTTNGAMNVTTINAANVTLATGGAGHDIKPGTINSFGGAVTLSAAGAIDATIGGTVIGDSLTASGTAIGSAGSRLWTSVAALTTTSSDGGTFITNTQATVLGANVTNGSLDVQTTMGALTATVNRSGTGGGVRLVTGGTASALRVNSAIDGGDGDILLDAAGAGAAVTLNGSVTTTGDVTIAAGTPTGRGALSVANGSVIAGDAVSIAARSIGTSSAAVHTSANTLDATAANGGIFVQETDGLLLNANATNGSVNVETLNGALTVDGASGRNITLTSGGAGNGIVVNGRVTTPDVAVLNAGGAITVGISGEVDAGFLDAVATSIGTSTERLNTNVDELSATTTNGGMFITEMDALTLTANATGGAVDVRAIGPLSVLSATGDGVTLGVLGGNEELRINGNIDGRAGLVSLTANGAIVADPGTQVIGDTLLVAGISVGSADARLNTRVATLIAQSVGGNIHVTEADDVTLTGNVLGGSLDVQTTNGVLSVSGANGDGVTLVANGAGKALDINGMVNSAGGDISLRAHGANSEIQLAGAVVTPGNVSMMAGTSSSPGAVVVSDGGGVIANALTVEGASIGSSANALITAVTSLDATSRNGDIYVTEVDDLSLRASAQGGGLNVRSLNGALAVTQASGEIGVILATDENGQSITLNGLVDGGLGGVGLFAGSSENGGAIVAGAGAEVRGNVLTATGASIGSGAARLRTNIDWLNGTATNGGIYVDELNGLSSLNVSASGGTAGDVEVLTATGDLGVRNVNATDTALLAAGGNIMTALTSVGVTARAAELRAGTGGAGQIGTTDNPLKLTLAVGDTLRIYSNSVPVITRSTGVTGTLSSFDAPNADVAKVGFGQFTGRNSTSLDPITPTDPTPTDPTPTDPTPTDPTPTDPTTPEGPMDPATVRAIRNEPSTTQSVLREDRTPADPDVRLLEIDNRSSPLCLPPDQRRDESTDSRC